ncbi:hypothetical protein [Bacillus atrophaeus]|uniref:hypothetical protein n=1 Tax=Bacillus atrophaeus TaxID=1452 RepID=UPI0022831B99|nr:hypothetical protein [Bacillus atrophaeus]MCY8499319.1 hypothetical protein [Bacillus atrophaeus]
MKELNCEIVPIQLINKSEIRLDHWYHELNDISFEKVLQFANSFDNSTSNNKHAIRLGRGDFNKGFNVHEDDFFHFLRGIFNAYKESDFKRQVTFNEAMHWISYEGIILKDVYKFATNNQLLPCNVTRFGGFNKMRDLKIPLPILMNPTDLSIQEFKIGLIPEDHTRS